MDSINRPIPSVPPELRAEAAKKPGGWVYVIDQFFPPDGRVPPYGVEGAWEVDDHGELTGEFRRNPRYRPSPQTLGMPEPRDAVDGALQLAATGYASEKSVTEALMDSEVHLASDEKPKTTVYMDTKGKFVPVYTSPEHAPTTAPVLERIRFRTLLGRLSHDIEIVLNPGSCASVRITAASLHQ